MAKNKSFLGTLVKLGGLAAATAVVYSRRKEIRGCLMDLAERYAAGKAEEETDVPEEEPEIVIDLSDAAEESAKEFAEESPAE